MLPLRFEGLPQPLLNLRNTVTTLALEYKARRREPIKTGADVRAAKAKC